MMELKEIGAVSLGKMFAIFGLIVGFFVDLFMTIISLILSSIFSIFATQPGATDIAGFDMYSGIMGPMMGYAGILGAVSIVIMPLLLGLLGFLYGAGIALVYNFIAGRFGGIDINIAEHWGDMQAKLERERNVMPSIDALIVSTAKINGMVIVTRNSKDMAESGIKILNHWK